MYETSVETVSRGERQFGSRVKLTLHQPEHGGQSALWWEALTKTSEKNACPYKSIGGAVASNATPVRGLERGRRQPRRFDAQRTRSRRRRLPSRCRRGDAWRRSSPPPCGIPTSRRGRRTRTTRRARRCEMTRCPGPWPLKATRRRRSNTRSWPSSTARKSKAAGRIRRTPNRWT